MAFLSPEYQLTFFIPPQLLSSSYEPQKRWGAFMLCNQVKDLDLAECGGRRGEAWELV